MSVAEGHPKWKASLDGALVAFASLEQPRGPTYRELADALGLASVSTAERWTRLLREEALIEEIPGRTQTDNRKYRLSPRGRDRARQLERRSLPVPAAAGDRVPAGVRRSASEGCCGMRFRCWDCGRFFFCAKWLHDGNVHSAEGHKGPEAVEVPA